MPKPPVAITKGLWGKRAVPSFLAAGIPPVPALLQAPGGVKEFSLVKETESRRKKQYAHRIANKKDHVTSHLSLAKL